MTENGDKIAAWADSCAIFFVQVLCLPENKDCRRLGVENGFKPSAGSCISSVYII